MKTKNNDLWQRFFSSLADKLLRFRWLGIFTVVLLTVFFAYQMQGLKFDNSNEVWFVEGDRSLDLLDKFREVFGNDDFVILLFESKNFFEPENIRRIKRLAEALEAEVPYLKEMTWLGNVEYIEGIEDGVKIHELLETVPEDPEEMAEIRKKALNEPTYVNSLISPDGQSAAIILEMEKYPEDGETLDPKNEIAPAVRKILVRPEFAVLNAYVAGGPIMHHDYDEIAGRETRKFMGICLLIQMAILLWVGRGVRGVFVPISIVFLSVLWTIGAIGLMGFTLNMMIVILPSLLICVGIGDSMHFIAEYQDHFDQGLSRKKAMLKTFSMVGLPCLLTTLTTMGAFLSFLTVRIRPFRELGVYASVGVVTALVLTFILVPFFYSFGVGKNARIANPANQKKRHDFFDRLLARIHWIVTAGPGWVVAFFVILALVSIAGALKIQVESNTAKMLSQKLPLRQAYDFIDERMGGSMSMEIMLDTGKTDGVKEPAFLRKMDALQGFADNHPLVTKTMSVLDVMKKMRRAMHNNDQEFYSVPDTREAASQYLFMYETSGGDQLDKLVSFDYDIARLTVKTRTLGTADVQTFMRDVEYFSRKTFDDSVSVEMTGALTWVKALNDKIGEGVKYSFTAVLFAVAALMMIFLRSVKLGLISMIPNVFPVLITLGLMGFTGIYLDMPLMCCSAIIIGVAVDDTIHFFRRYRREFKGLGDYTQALRATLSTVGRPITFTTMTLILGFGVMTLSDISGWSHFGFLAGFAFLWALLADFFFAPALILLLKPLGPEPGK
jgi:hydrophobe/amphiphile efflux-3 (HAE3) family protein